MKRWFGATLLACGVFLCGVLWQMSNEIATQAIIDEARTADVIVVLGAAEYRGKPSPVLRARLDHALALFKRGISTRILTTGGAGGDPLYTESEVGRSYLAKNGVPVESIIVENLGESTAQSTVAAAEIMRRMDLRSCIVVSDGYHIYRAKRMFERLGVTVYGSPRQTQARGTWAYRLLCLREAAGVMLWSVGVRL